MHHNCLSCYCIWRSLLATVVTWYLLLWLSCLIIGRSKIADATKSCVTCLNFSFHCHRVVMSACSRFWLPFNILPSFLIGAEHVHHVTLKQVLIASVNIHVHGVLLQSLSIVLLIHLGQDSKWSSASYRGSPLGWLLWNLLSTHCHSWLWESRVPRCSLLSWKGKVKAWVCVSSWRGLNQMWHTVYISWTLYQIWKYSEGKKREDAAELSLQPALLLTGSRWRRVWMQKGEWLRRSLWENDPTAHMIYDLSKHFLNEFMVSSTSFESYLT